MTPRHRASIRTHLLAIIVFGVIVPMALIGMWLTHSNERSGRALLANQLDSSLHNIVRTLEMKWEDRRGTLLLLADNQVTHDALVRGGFSHDDSLYLATGAGQLGVSFTSLVFRDTGGHMLFSVGGNGADAKRGLRPDPPPRNSHGTFHVNYPIRDGKNVLGNLEADVLVDAILPSDSARLLLPGSSVAVRERAGGSDMLHLAGASPFPTMDTLSINGAEWMARDSSLVEPQLDIAVGAPIGPYAAPFIRDARISLLALLMVAMSAVLLAIYFTTRLSRSVQSMVETTAAVAGGDLGRRVESTGPQELQTLASSFNAMTASLRKLIAELSERRALTAVGEFAAALAHEVRNALTAIQIDLERVDERTEDIKNRALIDRSLNHVRRLDAAVTGSLRIARSGRVEQTDVAINDVLDHTLRVAEPSFAATSTLLIGSAVDETLMVRGDAEALHQLFLNLLLNAQQSLGAGGETKISASRIDGRVIVAIADNGRGMTKVQIEHAFDPYYTTRPQGTGLGLPIARQIAAAHGGEIRIESVPDLGTRVEVWFPSALG